jgi:hypothetical protein
MLEISNVKVYDLKESVIACRNAMRTEMPEYTDEEFEKSLPRAIQLANTPSGSGHQNWLKGVRVSFDIKYPNYISPELQRYNFIDIVSSSSKMHKLMSMDLDFACNKYVPAIFVDEMKKLINKYKAIKEDDNFISQTFLFRDGNLINVRNKQEALYIAFMQCISACPLGLELFMRVSTNYKQLQTIYYQRKNHKLKEDWGAFCKMIEELPYFNELILGKDVNNDETN